MTMYTAPTKGQYRSAFQLMRGQYALQFGDVRKLIEDELTATIDKLMQDRDASNIQRLQGRAQVLKDFLAFFDSSSKHVD